MTDNLPVPAGAPPPPGDVLLGALAMAAARIAAEQASTSTGPAIGREEAEAIAREAVVEAFKLFGVDLDRIESVEAHRATIEHARKSKAAWGKAAGTIWTGVWTAIAGLLIAAVTKYVSFGGVK